MAWAYSTDEEIYHGDFKTAEDAADEAFSDYPEHNTMWVGEKYSPCAESYIDADLLIDHVACQDEYSLECAEDWPGASKEQLAELADIVRREFGAWLDRHGLRQRFFLVKNVRKFSRE